MLRVVAFCLATLAVGASSPTRATGQTEPLPEYAGSDPPATFRWTSLPTDRNLRLENGLPIEPSAPQPLPPLHDGPPQDLKSLLRPRLDFAAEWEPQVDQLAIASYDVSMQLPIYPIFGPPPPFITSGYSFTQIDAPTRMTLPASLHEFSLGLAWMRRINDKWMSRITLSGAFASDLKNTGSDAWQIRAGVFAMYRPNDCWSFAFGALATGRDDVPILPAVGAIWEPSPKLRVNLMMPTPRVSMMLFDTGDRQHWGYVGGGISGGTWAYDRLGGVGQRLTYREWRLVLGWESKRPQPPGTFRPSGSRFSAEIGYAFGREFEFDGGSPDISLGDALLLRTRISF